MKPFLVAVLLLISSAAIADFEWPTSLPLSAPTEKLIDKICARDPRWNFGECVPTLHSWPIIATYDQLPATEKERIAVTCLIETEAAFCFADETADAVHIPKPDQTTRAIYVSCDIRFREDGPAAYRQCIDSENAKPEFATFEKLSRRDRRMILDTCGDGETHDTVYCLIHQIRNAAHIAEPVVAPPPPASLPPEPTFWEARRAEWNGLTFWEKCFKVTFGGIGCLLLVTLVVYLVGELLRMLRQIAQMFRRPVYIPAAPPHPYFSGMAMDPLKERSAHGSGDFATATPLHSSLNGSASRGEPPKFED